MNQQVNEMIKNMIDENVVAFKENTAKVLYEKTGKKIESAYQTVAQNLLKQNQSK